MSHACAVMCMYFSLDNRNCPPGNLGIEDKCFWFLCKANLKIEGIPIYPETRCMMDLGILASLNASSGRILAEYLNKIQVRNVEISQIIVGLSRKDKRWIWRDGTVYNGSDTLGYENSVAVLAWNKQKETWVLQSVPFLSGRLNLCERPKSMYDGLTACIQNAILIRHA